MIEIDALKEALYRKALRTPDGKLNSPRVISESEIGRFLNNIEFRAVGINRFLGKEVQSFEEAKLFLNEVATQVYSKNSAETQADDSWALKLVKNEVMYGSSKTYGINSKDSNVINSLQAALINVADVLVRQPSGTAHETGKEKKAKKASKGTAATDKTEEKETSFDTTSMASEEADANE